MILTFLKSSIPLTKTFVRHADSAGFKSSPYPGVRDFTSINETVETITDLYETLRSHADQGHCLLKGNTRRTLNNESRAGSTQPDLPTDYLVLDLDFDEDPLIQNIEVFLRLLFPNSTGGYVFQRSASSGITRQSAIRGHIFLPLAQPITPRQAKQYLIHWNLTLLKSLIRLSANGFALRWPLDVSTCQNDKLIYIAPPVVQDADGKPLPDPLHEQRWIAVDGPAWILPNQPNPERLETETQVCISRLRREAKYPARRARTATYPNEPEPVLTNPAQGVVTEHKIERGFIYLNLNNGDSWGYFMTPTSDIVRNFKGEPPFLLSAFDPEFRNHLDRALEEAEPPKQEVAYTFRDRHSDQYYTILDTNPPYIQVVKNRERLLDFRRLHNLDPKEPVDLWTVHYDFHSTVRVDPVNKMVNLYDPGAYLGPNASLPAHPNPSQFPIINRILHNVVGNLPEAMDHLTNWLACIVQFRKKIGTAWILQGHQGSGKGLLVNAIMGRILGRQHVASISQNALEDPYHTFRERCLLVMLDEAHLPSNEDRTIAILNRLKSMITESETSIRVMFHGFKNIASQENYILTTNQTAPVWVEPTDRRFLVGPPATALKITSEEIEVQLPQEIHWFASWLLNYPADMARARKVDIPVLEPYRPQAHRLGTNSVGDFFTALKAGDLRWFANELMNTEEQIHSSSTAYFHYDRIVKQMFADANDPENPTRAVRLARSEIALLLNYIRDKTTRAGALTKMLDRAGIEISKMRRGTELIRGYEFIATQYDLDQLLTPVTEEPSLPKATPITQTQPRIH